MDNFALKILPCSVDFQEPNNGILRSVEGRDLQPGGTAVIPFGFKAWFPESFVALIGSTNDRRDYEVLTTMIRGGDQKEWEVRIRSTSAVPFTLTCGAPVASFVLVPRMLIPHTIVDDLPAPAGKGINPKGLEL